MKKCKFDNCNRDVFSHSYCKYHQNERTDDKAMGLKNVVSKSYIIPKTKIKAKFKAPTGQLDMFKEIWNERHHVSELNGDKLYYFDINYFHHLLHKSSFPKFLLFKPNIILLTKQQHHQIETRAMSDLIKEDDRWLMVQERYQKLKEMYNHGLH